MNAVELRHNDLCGLYELDLKGKILYYKAAPNFNSDKTSLKKSRRTVIRFNFFTQIADFKNAQQMQQRFDNFANGNGTVEIFVFQCVFDNYLARLRLMMVWLNSAQIGKEHEKKILVDIRQA